MNLHTAIYNSLNKKIKKEETNTCECGEVHPLKYSVSDKEDGNASCPNCYRSFLEGEYKKLKESFDRYKYLHPDEDGMKMFRD